MNPKSCTDPYHESDDESDVSRDDEMPSWMMYEKDEELERKYEGVDPDDAGLVSRLFMWWMTPLVIRGLTRDDPLEGGQVPQLPGRYRTEVVAPRAKESWEREMKNAEAENRKPSLVWVLADLWSSELKIGLAWALLQGLASTVAKPYFLLKLIDEINDGNTDSASYYLPILVLALLIEGISTSTSRQYFTDRFGSAFLSTASTLLQSKAHRVVTTTGINERPLLGTDIFKTYESFKQLAMAPMSLSSLAGGIVMLFFTIGWTCVFGFIVIVVVLAITTKLAHLTTIVEHHALNGADERIAIATRIIEGIKAIKYSAWEPQFLSAVNESRDEECVHIKQFRFYHMVCVQLGRCTPILASCATFIAFGGLGFDLEASRVFAALTIFQALRLALTAIPSSISLMATFFVAMDRLSTYLSCPEVQVRDSTTKNGAEFNEGSIFTWEIPTSDSKKKSKKNEQSDNAFSLSIPNELTISKGEVTAIVGKVGSGKTSMLSALLGDMPCRTGKVLVNKDVGYVPQRSFVVSGHIRDNILMGRKLNNKRLIECIKASALDVDLQTLPAGIETAIGERGITLSGGQQHRLCIARALYGRPQLLALDDPLAAVDSTVASTVFGSLKRYSRKYNISVVLVMNQLHFIPEADKIIFLKEGIVSNTGSYKTLIQDPASEFSQFYRDGEFSTKYSTSLDDVPKESSPSKDVQISMEKSTVEEQQTSAKLFKTELKEEGEIREGLTKEYVKAMGYTNLILGMSFCASAYGFMGFGDRWLSIWIENYDDYLDNRYTNFTTAKPDLVLYSTVYASACVCMVICLILSSTFFGRGTTRASATLHHQVMRKLLYAPLSWHQETPSGRIVSRLSSDMSVVDNFLAQFIEHCANFFWTIIILFVVMIIVVPPVLAVLFVTTIVYIIQTKAADSTNRDLKRLANNSMGPVLTAVSETIHGQGRTLLRSMHLVDSSESLFGEKVNALNRYNFVSSEVIAWQNFWCYFLASLISIAAATYMIWGPQSFTTSELGLALTYCFLLPYFLLYFSFTFSILRLTMTSLERLQQYNTDELPQETEYAEGYDDKSAELNMVMSSDWPQKGEIRFNKTTLIYRPGLPPALKGVSFTVKGGEKVGVVGRTGAGKSSLLVVLFRLVDHSEGDITIDGVSISGVKLADLRSKFGIIPQEPLLMTGTIRQNLDPFNNHSDKEILEAINRVGLTKITLNQEVGSDADNLSSGQRQLISVARIMLRNVKIIIMDEPTSSIDPVTDALVQKTVRDVFSDCTVITIAHRLHTVIDSNHIIVMNAGNISEEGTPKTLLDNPDSHLSRMVNDLDRSTHQG